MIIEIDRLHKKFGDLEVIREVSISVKAGEFCVLLGPSGCGKSTLLNMIAGFDKPNSGTVKVFGKPVEKSGRHYGFVFQDYALFPWKTVVGNVESGLLYIRNKTERRERALHYIERVGLTEFRDTYPHKLSGGMKQRVGIARALAYDPEILLMDEPFGALDAQTRKLMQQELIRILKGENKTIVFVTHSVIEAVYLADKVVVMGKRPSTVMAEIRIEMEHERSYVDERYLEYRKKILHYLDAETGVQE